MPDIVRVQSRLTAVTRMLRHSEIHERMSLLDVVLGHQ